MQTKNPEIEKQLNKYKEEGFDEGQLNEIKLGLEAGIDVSKFAKKEYFAIQMREVRLGLEENLPVFIYNHAKYDWFQMEEIRLGLERGVDATIYAKSTLPYDKMRQIRKGLEEGFHLEKFENLDAGILRELRYAHRDQVNIITYIQAGYDADQLAQIREALIRKCNIDDYIDIWYRASSIKEIWQGLEMGLDVSVYAKPCYNWRQMEEIRLGLAHRVDVSFYAKELANWRQMHEIRRGLEEKLDVSKYISLMYSHTDMRRIRKALELEQEQLTPDAAVEGAELLLLQDEEGKLVLTDEEINKVLDTKKADPSKVTPEELAKHITVSFEKDDLEAYVSFPQGSAPIATASVWISTLKNFGVIMGIDVSALARFQIGDFPDDKILVAKGEYPIPGDDGFYECLYDNKISFKPVVQEDGSVDYSQSTWFKTVHKDDILIIYHPSTVGKNGWTVKGKIAAGKHGREIPALYGTGFRLLKDQVTYVADVSGGYDFDGKKLMITPFLEVPELTAAMGNVNFDGTIHVKGNVGDNVSVKASGDVVIDGFVENASIVSGGDIVVNKGANGKGLGELRAKGSIKGQFFENIKLEAGVDINSNYCLNCLMNAENNIIIAGRKGVISSGTACARHLIEAEVIGNKAGSRTNIKLGVSDYSNAKERKMEKNIADIDDQLGILKNAFDDMVKKFAVEERNANPLFIKIEDAIYTKERERGIITQNLENLKEENSKLKRARLKVSGTIYEGSYIQINGVSAKLTTMKRSVIKYSDGVIEITKL